MANSVMIIPKTGKSLFESFFLNSLIERTRPITKIIGNTQYKNKEPIRDVMKEKDG
jgi:hypothetical protein